MKINLLDAEMRELAEINKIYFFASKSKMKILRFLTKFLTF